MSSTTPRRAFVTLVRDALASANASRLARPLHAKVKVQPPQHHPSADPAYRYAEPTRSADAPAPLASWRGASATWRDEGRARGASKLPSFRFPEALSATDTTERGAYASDVASASSRAASLEAEASDALRAYAASRRDPVLADALGLEFNQRAMRSFHSPMRKHLTLDPLISEYSVDSPEGVALMSLAEALIRVPAGAGAYMPDRLIRDTIGAGHLDFMSHLRKDKSALVNASAVALAAVRRVVGEKGSVPTDDAGGVFSFPDANDAKVNDPKPRFAVDAPLRFAVKRAIGLLSTKFTMGDTIGNALRRAKANERAAWAKTRSVVSHSFDVLGEGARTEKDAARYLASYVDAAHAIASSGVTSPQMSVKLSSLSPRFDELSRRECVDDLARKLASVVPGAASPLCVFVDAEEQRRLELTLSVVEATLSLKRHDPPKALGVVVQAYGRRAMHALEFLKELAHKHPATEIRVRLVKGAYWDAEMKEAQISGADAYPVWTQKRMTDASYLSCAAFLMDNVATLPRPAFATHNARTVADVLAMAGGDLMRGDGGDAERAVGESYRAFIDAGCEFQRLHGMGESFDYAGLPTRVYSPVGQPDDLLAYLIRRLLENGANSSFLKSLANGREDLMNADALAPSAEGRRDAKDSASGLPASPRDIYGGSRLSARGVDYENPGFPASFAATAAFAPSAESVVVFPGASEDERFQTFLDGVRSSRAVSGDAMSARVLRRAETLERAADLIEEDTTAMAKLIMQEAGKTLVDAVDEVRECVDFFRFYARRARETLTTPTTLRTVTGESCTLRAQPRGPWLCVGPFNFPFAIVGGLASSAFVAGNPVVIKPHPATPKCAAALADVLKRAGAEDDAIAVVVDDATIETANDATTETVATAARETAGSALVESGVFAGVSFVGSTRVAADINLSLARVAAERGAPLARLVAETGGLNALVVDASALPEQACDAILRSFAQSAGQRCSSARLLIVDAGVKRELLGMLKGALEATRVSKDVADVATDVGPLISRAAADAARAHCAALESRGGVCAAKTLGEDDGALFHPRVYDLNPEKGSDPVEALELCSKEVFAPVLHVVTYDGSREALRETLEAINAKGFALTGGVMTRCESTKALVADTLDCGNFYVNRDVVGAVVESQPFGGHGLSGNGAKAGSEHYLEQFVARKVVCEDTTAAGGNLELMRTTG